MVRTIWSHVRKGRTLGARLRRLGILVLALGLALTLGPVACFRVVDPPTSAFMLRDGFSRLRAGKKWVTYQWADLDQIAPALPLAVVASEDQRFPQHDGFDVAAIEKAMKERRRGGPRGASTISQQVAKNLFLWPRRSWLRKGLEVYFTVAIEALWPKRRILEVYVNVAEFGDGLYGADRAAARYFGVPPRRLTAHQAALLAAVLPSPRRMRADRPGPYTEERARWIEGQMRQLGSAYLAGL
jgi:monofunctional biosynthetic peptidoglycan transglycosylase